MIQMIPLVEEVAHGSPRREQTVENPWYEFFTHVFSSV